MSFNFAATLSAKIFGNAANSLLEGFTDALIAFDPQAASEAQLDIFRNQIEKFSQEFVDAKAKMQKEQSNVTNLQAQVDKNMAALKILKDRLDKLPEGDGGRAALLLQAQQIDEVITRLEEQEEIEKKEAAMAVEFYNAIHTALDQATAKYDQAKRRLGSVVHDLKMAELAKNQAAAELEQARQLEKLRASGGDGSDPMSRIAAVAAKQKLEAEGMSEASARIRAASGTDTENLADKILQETATAKPSRDPFARLSVKSGG
jgi:hypothetical protein